MQVGVILFTSLESLLVIWCVCVYVWIHVLKYTVQIFSVRNLLERSLNSQ